MPLTGQKSVDHTRENNQGSHTESDDITVCDSSNRKGPYSVTINLIKGVPEVTNCITSGQERQRFVDRAQRSKGRNLLEEYNRESCAYQSVSHKQNGFSLKRFLPGEQAENCANAYFLANSQNSGPDHEGHYTTSAQSQSFHCDRTSLNVLDAGFKERTVVTEESSFEEKANKTAGYLRESDRMSGDVAGIANPAFSDENTNLGTAGKYRTVINSNEVPHYVINAGDDKTKSDIKIEKEKANSSEATDSVRYDGQDKAVPLAQVAPTLQEKRVTDAVINNNSVDPESVAIAMVNGGNATNDKTADSGPSVSVNMELKPAKQNVKKTNSMQNIFDKVKTPTTVEMNPSSLPSADSRKAVCQNAFCIESHQPKPAVPASRKIAPGKESVRFGKELEPVHKTGRKHSKITDLERDEDTKWLEWIESKFKDIAGDDGEISREEFKVALGVKKSFFAERFFELFDQDSSGTIELGELMDGLRMLTKGTPAQKLQFLFDVYDVDGSGTVERDELKEVLKACMEESSLSLTEDNLEDLTDALFDSADSDESGAVTFEELRAELEKHPGVIENLTISAAQWLKIPEKTKSGFKVPRHLTKKYLANNLRKVVYFFLYWILNIILFVYAAAWQYRASNNWIKIARGCGLCLNFNCMWVLVLMLRKCLTFIRMTKLCHVLPLDQHILFHKMTGLAIAGFSLVHSVAHVGNAATVSNTTPLEMWEVLFTNKAGVGFVDGSAFITGWILDVILIIMVICSMPFVRRSGHFQVFYWTHMLYVPFWILVILHGPHFWKWFVAPGVMFILEKIFRSKIIKMARYGDTFIDEVNLLPSGVTHLIITRPLNFKYQPGDYVFLQIPVIAQHEWHPFTISSAPEMEGHIWLHVRSAGHWTNKLYKYFDELEVKEPIKGRHQTVQTQFSGFERAFSRKASMPNSGRALYKKKSTSVRKRQTNKLVKVKCYVDGPYGTGTREVFNTDHAVLIGSGIGVTPMASILQSVWYRFSSARQVCPSCTHSWYNEETMSHIHLNKMDFIWINRDQKAFEWFLTILNQLEVEQSAHHGALERCIQIHLYMTAAQKKTDMKGIGLQIALELMHEKSHVDLITGLRTKTQPGRPDFDKLFKAIKAENQGKVKVFFCGAPQLGRVVKDAAQRYDFAFAKENF